MNTIGIITIHKINNYGSVLQAYALQYICESLGYCVEIIDYLFPNTYHVENNYKTNNEVQPNEPAWLKAFFGYQLFCQHKRIRNFVNKHQRLSTPKYSTPEDLQDNPPQYDIYITGSDQLWNPRYCNGDPAFMLHFAPDNALKISYAASIGTDTIPENLKLQYKKLLNRYAHISVRENSSVDVIRDVVHKDTTVVLDPTLLLTHEQWNEIASSSREFNRKYILCYFLNYSFNAFPYVDQLAEYIHRQTGYEIVRVARPPHKLCLPHTHYRIGASPEEFIALIRDAEIVLTTSFHGTAFAVNYGKPVFSVVQNRTSSDSRQVSLMLNLGLSTQILSIDEGMPDISRCFYDIQSVQERLSTLRKDSIDFLKQALKDE